VVDVDAVVGAAAEPVGEVEERLGDPAGDVGEDQVRYDVVGLAEPARELGQQSARHRGTALEPAEEVLVRERGERAVGDRGDRRGARAGVEQGELAEHLAGAQDRQQVLAAVGGGPTQLHLAVDDDVELVALVALTEQDLAAAQLGLGHRSAQGGRGLVVEGTEQRCLTQHVVIHELSSSSTPGDLPGGASGHSVTYQAGVSPKCSRARPPYDVGRA
jgi:hypothetical protein